MISSWRRLRAAWRAGKEHHPDDDKGESFSIKDTVVTTPPSTSTPPGITFDRVNVENKRIPKPSRILIPVSSPEVLEINSNITTACKREDQVGCRDSVKKIKKWAKESEANKRCIASNGAVSVLAAAFQSFSMKTCTTSNNNLDYYENVSALEEVLSTLTLLFPLHDHGEASTTYLGSASSMRCLVWFLKTGESSRRRNAVLVLRELVSTDPRKVNVLLEIEGATDELFKLIKEPICTTATKASLVVIRHAITSSSSSASSANEKNLIIIRKFSDMGLVSLLLEKILVDAERSVCEKALGVLDGICSSDHGRREACANALTMPVVVKKILRVSDLATEFSVSVLWKLLCKKNEKGGEEEEKSAASVVEALQVGAFHKLLLVLQVGCDETTKEKVSELLKLLNLHKSGSEDCIDSMDFKS